jgi:signal transduction histidine kinase
VHALETIWRPVGFSLTIVLLFSACLSAQNTKNVLVLHEGNANHPANVISSGVFRELLASDARNQFFEEYIDEDRLGASDERLEVALLKKYGDRKMDLVIGDGRPGFTFLLRRGEELWPTTPKLFYFVDFRELPAKLPPNMTGVATNLDFGAILDLALQLRPNTRRVFYVGGANPWEQTWRGFAEQDFKRFAGRVEITYLNNLPFAELLDRLGRLPDNSAVIYAELLQDVTGHVYVPARVCSLIASASNAPVYGPFDTYVGCGIVGGPILDIRDLAAQTGRLGLRVLERGTTTGFPVESSTKHTVVDWRELQRWRISEKRLPLGTTVQFRTPSLWEQYKWFVLGGLAAIVAQFALIVILLWEMHRRKKSDLAVKNLSGRLINAGEEERKRIARELHDDIVQRLSLLSVECSLMERNVPADEVSRRSSLHEQLQGLNGIITDVHNLSYQLHSSHLEMLGLGVALEDLCQQLTKKHGVAVELTANTVEEPLDEDLALCFFRVAQEALNNSLKHSGSTRVEVSLTAIDGTLRMTVKDYGVGFDSSAPANGLGLATMLERMRLVEGKLRVRSKLGAGTELTAEANLVTSARQAPSGEPYSLVSAEDDTTERDESDAIKVTPQKPVPR